ncbi:MAG: hypothetical protein AAGE88_09845 [Actinomycetota bacterium]
MRPSRRPLVHSALVIAVVTTALAALALPAQGVPLQDDPPPAESTTTTTAEATTTTAETTTSSTTATTAATTTTTAAAGTEETTTTAAGGTPTADDTGDAGETADAGDTGDAGDGDPAPAEPTTQIAEAVGGAATLRAEAPTGAEAGTAFTVEVEIDVADTVAAYRVDIEAAATEIEPTTAGVLNPADLVTDRSVGSLGDRAVLAATSCADTGCESGDLPAGSSGVLDLGSVAVTPSSGGSLDVVVTLTELAGPDGVAVGETPVATATLTLAVTGATVEAPVEVAEAEDGGDDDANGPVAEEIDPEADFATDVVEDCDPAEPDCVSIADLQAAETEEAAPEAPVAAATAANSVLTLVVDTASDVQPAWDTNTGNGICATPAGDCTLRAAMQEANAFPGHVTILFDIPGTGPHTIQLVSNLPATTDDAGVTIDGYSQAGAAPNTDPLISNAVIMVEIRGNGAANHDALKIRSDNNVIQGLAVYDARRPIWVFGASDNRFVGNFIGTDATGTFATNVLAPTAHGIHMEGQSARNVIGTAAPADRNVVSGNARHGIGIWHHNSDDNTIQNNIVGLAPDGVTPLPNAKHGIDVNFGAARTIVGGLGSGEGNLVSANLDSGIEVSHNPLDNQGSLRLMATQVLGNRVGTYADGESFDVAIENYNTGVYIEDGVNDTVVEGNIIGNNGKGGVRVLNGGSNGVTTGTVIRNNWIGVSPSGVAMPNGQVGVSVESSTTTVGPGNVIGYNAGPGVFSSEFDALSNTVTQNAMVANTGLGIDLSPLGTNANDAGDADTGPNTLLNWPEFSRTTDLVFEGTACAGCTVEFFSVDTSVGAGLAGGTYLGSVTADGVTGAFSFANPSLAQGVTVTATATDASGSTSEFAPASAVVEHSDPPTVDAGLDVSVDEGGTVDLTATATDPDDDFLTYDWDLDGDAVFETPGQTVTFDAAAIDGPDTRTITVQTTDDTGLTATDSLVVTIDNVAPTATLDTPATVDEAATFAVSLTGATDPSADDVTAGLRFDIACPGETLPAPDYATASTSSAKTCTAPDGPASLTVEARILDDDGGVTSLSMPVTVANVAPSVVIGGTPGAADEGDQLSLTTTVSDVSADDETAGFTYAWTALLDGSPVATGTTDALTLDLTDSGTWTITVEVTDADGGVGTDSRQLVVNNIDPSAELTTDTVADAGQVDVTLTMTNPVDPGTDDVAAGLRYAFDCEGGSLAAATYATASTSPTTLCSYTTGASVYPVSGVIIDKDEGRTEYATSAAVGNNQAPSVSVGASFTVDEAASITVTATGTDPEGGTITYDWDLDGDGTYETTGQSPTFDAAAIDGPAAVAISVQVTDAVGLTASATSSVLVANLDPSAAIAPYDVDEGTTFTVDLSGATDPAPADQAALRYAVDCTGGSLAAGDYAAASPTATFDCVYDDGPDSGSVTARVLDDDGGVIDLSAAVTVANVDPTATITPPAANPVEGDTVSVPLGATDPSTTDTGSLGVAWTATFDGSPLASGSGATADFVPPDDGVVTLDLTVTDKDGGVGTVQALITVDGAAPTGAFVAPPTADEGVDFDIEIQGGVDVGPTDTADGLRYVFSCDGSPITDTYATAGATPATTCATAGAGTQTVTGRIIDADDLFTEYTALVSIGNVAPMARFVVPRQGVAGRTITVEALSPSEPGLTYAFDCGSGFGAFSATAQAACVLGSGPTQTVAVTVHDVGGLETTYDGLVVVHPDLTGNASFEIDADGDNTPDGWTLPGSGAVTRTTGAAFEGTHGLQATSTTAKSSSIRTGLFPAARSAYVLSGWFNLVDAGTNASAQLEVTWYDSSGSAISTSRSDTLTTASGTWVGLEKRIVAPNGTAQARVRAKIITDGGAIVYADDVLLRQDNELVNADFDLDADGNDRPDTWWNSSRFHRTDVEVHDTAYGGELTSDGSGFTTGQRVRQIVGGEDYEVHAWVYVTPEAAGTPVRLRVRWKDAGTSNISVPVVAVINTATPGWVQIGGTLTAPANAVEANYEVRIGAGLGVGEVIYLDSTYFGLS